MKKAGRAVKTKKSKKGRTGNVASQKRFVSAVKVFLTDAEKEVIREKVGNFNSLSNYIRHHLGLPINTVGRKKRHIKSALDLDLDELEIVEKPEKTEKVENAGEIEKVAAMIKPDEVADKIESSSFVPERSLEVQSLPEAVKKPLVRMMGVSGGQKLLWDEVVN